MRKPDEIKNGLNHCSEDGCKQCSYKDDCDMADGFSVLAGDANAYIHQLENQIDELTEKVAQAEAAQSKWISVDDRLPDVEVLAANFAPKTYGYKEYIIGYVSPDWRKGEYYAENDHEILYNVTHWMSLPPPPKEDVKK